MSSLTDRLCALEAEEVRRLNLDIWRLDPLQWLEDRFGEDRKFFEWSAHGGAYDTHIWDGDKDPLVQAWEDVASKKWAAVVAATGCAKTFWLSRLIFWFLDVYEDSLVVTTAPSANQLTVNLWGELDKAMEKFKGIRPFTRKTKASLKPEGENRDNPYIPYYNSYMATAFVARAGASEDSATKAQGFHRKDMLIICEEAAGMHAAMMTALQNTCTGSNNIIVAVGNPDSETDQLNQFAILGNVSAYRISAYDYPNVVLGEEIYQGAVSQISIDRRREKYGEDSPMYQSRVRGLTPSDSENVLIKRGWVKSCFVSEMPTELDSSFNAVGVDVSNSETGDKASTAWGKANVLTEVLEFQCPNASHLAENLVKNHLELAHDEVLDFQTPTIYEYAIRMECIGVDAVGVGVSTINRLKDFGVTPTGLQGGQWDWVIPKEEQVRGNNERVETNLYNFSGLRDQMYWELREDIRKGLIKIFIADDAMREQIVLELTIPKFNLKSSKIAVEGKDSIKKRMGGKSPNVADAVVYWNWVRKGYNVGGAMPAIR